MAVYERSYKPYAGRTTPHRWRFLVLPRYSLKRLFASRLTLAYYVACHVPAIVGLVIIYLSHNLAILERFFGVPIDSWNIVNAAFFQTILRIQGIAMGFVLMLIVGPGLVSTDTVNNALPLYFSRPFTRTEYVVGKMTVLVGLLSTITWIPGLLLFLLQSYLERGGWLADNIRVAVGIFFGSWVWILTITLIAMAVSASTKRRVAAMIHLFGLFLLVPSFGSIVGGAIGLWWGWLLNIWVVFAIIWTSLFGTAQPLPDVGPTSAWIALLLIWGICLLVLNRRVRAYEIVR